MLLAIDIGNTQTVIGLYGGEAEGDGTAACGGSAPEPCARWRIATKPESTADELLAALRGLFALDGSSLAAVSGFVVASVVPSLTARYHKLGRAMCGSNTVVVTSDAPHGLSIKYANPTEIGADRIADAVAAVALYGAPVIVVDFGTATNIEIVDKSGAFVGGVIAPGLQTSANALFNAAARLTKVSLEVPDAVIGTSTAEAVRSGLTYGEIDRIDGLIGRIFAQLGYKAPVVATGGLSGRVVGLSRTITDVNDDLTLEGLRLIWERSR